MRKRTAVYCGTRNLYHDMAVAAKSLLANRGADEVVFLTEDEDFPEPLPECIRCINVSGQTFFPKHGPNYNNPWSYMSLMRTALTKILTEESVILSLDVDTIVCGNLDALWNIDLKDNFFAAVPETGMITTYRPKPYYNFGVMLMNLDMLRKDGTDDAIILYLNMTRVQYIEQDATNWFCRGKTISLPEYYNTSIVTAPHSDRHPVLIRHFASEHPWQQTDVYRKYEAMSWEEITGADVKTEKEEI